MSLIRHINGMFKGYGTFPFVSWKDLGQNTWCTKCLQSEHGRAASSHGVLYKALSHLKPFLLTMHYSLYLICHFLVVIRWQLNELPKSDCKAFYFVNYLKQKNSCLFKNIPFKSLSSYSTAVRCTHETFILKLRTSFK